MNLKNPNVQLLSVKELKFLPFNRAMNTKHVTSLLNSMTEYTILRLPVIVKTKIFGKLDHYILDAQHMISALMKAEHEKIQCIVIEENDVVKIINTMAVLNNTACVWKIDDYVNAYCHMPGKEDYRLLKVHHLATGFNYTVSAKILNGNTSGIKNGKFKVHCDDADIVTKRLVEVSSLFNTNSAKFMLAYITFSRNVKGYDHKKFMQLAARNKDKFQIIHDTSTMVTSLHQMYK